MDFSKSYDLEFYKGTKTSVKFKFCFRMVLSETHLNESNLYKKMKRRLSENIQTTFWSASVISERRL